MVSVAPFVPDYPTMIVRTPASQLPSHDSPSTSAASNQTSPRLLVMNESGRFVHSDCPVEQYTDEMKEGVRMQQLHPLPAAWLETDNIFDFIKQLNKKIAEKRARVEGIRRWLLDFIAEHSPSSVDARQLFVLFIDRERHVRY